MNLKIFIDVMGWNADDLIEIRAIGSGMPCRFFQPAGELEELADTLTELNQQGYNLYAGILPRKDGTSGALTNCLPGSVLWADFDSVDSIPQLPLEPTLIVNSGHGFHVYWRLDEIIPLAELKLLLKAVAKVHGADMKAAEPARVMRIPGFMNHKAAPVPCQIISYNPDAVYSISRFKAIYELATASQCARPSKPLAERKRAKKPQKELRNFRCAPEGSSWSKVASGRLEDFFRLLDMRQGQFTGLREVFLWQVLRHATIAGMDNPRTLIVDINQKFTDPLPEEEMAISGRGGDDAYSMPSDKWLIENFQITREELACLNTIKSEETRQEGNAQRQRKFRANRKVKSILKLREEGLSIREIAEKVSVSRSQVARILDRDYQ